nr:immunoglobulin light chain junction region [Macaca mulatta]MPN91204.1 immunoglobulin light chain junction region [Macaca mulatta]MPN92153.1 immunoglobulin light chain junction region [Macaca mulatta]MPN92397.1 immunoglobulin light chain junction region [Macaca mulatta]MPN92664.1 immunoglobulin light chain junction region [Macaca mulatta]
CQHYYSIPYSF